jgi:hypothetical protein
VESLKIEKVDDENYIIIAEGIFNTQLGITPIYALGLNGSMLWKYRANGHILNWHVAYGSRYNMNVLKVIYNDKDDIDYKHFREINLKDGDVLGEFCVANNVEYVSLYDEKDIVFVGTSDGYIFAFDRNNVDNDRHILLREILETSPTIYDVISDIINHIDEQSNQKKPFMNTVKIKNLLNEARKFLEDLNFSKAIETVNKINSYLSSNIEMDVRLEKTEFEVNTWETLPISINYLKGNMPLYNLKIECSDDFKIKQIKSIDVIYPTEYKTLELLILPLYKGKFPLELYVSCEDEEGNPLEKAVYEQWVEVKGGELERHNVET